ncbi:hypothetical protein FKP32DRAFT_1598017 [Trametes sanguinea]|nr:hypothetical protein FKP32DRAFT_1598017 [Trametes sanguinea]
MASLPLSFSYDGPFERYDSFEEDESDLTSAPLPPTINVTDPDVLRNKRRSDKKAAKLLDITIAREDVDYDMESPGVPGFDSENGEQLAGMDGRVRRSSMTQLNIGTLSLRESPLIHEREDDGTPLFGSASPTKGTRRVPGKARRKIGAFLQRLQRGKPSKLPSQAVRATLASVVSEDHVDDPFGDEHAMDWEGDEDAETSQHASSIATGSTPAAALAPKTPQRGRCTSTPNTPRASPWSAKSPRSSASWQKSPRTPRSAKSWLSDSSPGSLSIAGSVASSLRRKNVRRRQRQLTSQMKSMQILGSEAGAAIAKAANVKETKLRYREFDRKLRDQFKRRL